jgi:type II secretion system protein I
MLKPNPVSKTQGFTLLEVMAATAILSIALVVLLSSQTQSIRNVITVQNYERAVYITENQLHWTFLDLNEAEDWAEYSSLTGEDGDFLWNVEITEAASERANSAGAGGGQVSVEPGSQIAGGARGGGGFGDIVLLKVVATTAWPEGKTEKTFQLETYYLWGAQQ